MGGQQPVSSGVVQLWAAGNTGYGSASTALITGFTVTTSDGTGAVGTTGNDSNNFNLAYPGSFNITGDFNCPVPAATPAAARTPISRSWPPSVPATISVTSPS